MALDGGAIRAQGNLTLNDDVISDSQAAPGEPGQSSTGASGGAAAPSPAVGGGGDPGGDGGAVYATQDLTVTGTRFDNDTAGAGGASGNAKGGDGAITSTAAQMSNIDGAGALVFGAGSGGNGGAIWAGDGATITGSTFTSDSAGAGGPGGNATGGNGGLYAFDFVTHNPPVAGNGGGAAGGNGGAGGSGGAVYVDTGTASITQSTFTGDTSGAGGAGGTGTGGAGSGEGLLTGSGGGSQGGTGGASGSGGAVFTAPAASTLTLSASTLSDSATASAGAGGAATGGSAGLTPSDCQTNGASPCVGSTQAGNAQGGTGGAAGSGGALSIAAGGHFTNVTASANAAGAGGAGGLATAGRGVPATATGGTGGAGGLGGAIANATANLSVGYTTLSANVIGPGGAGGAPSGTDGAAGSGGAVDSVSGTVTLASSIITDNSSLACQTSGTGTIADGHDDVRPSGNDSCPGTEGDAGLGPLRDNGGPVFTQAPSATGAAIDAAGTAGCPATDARGAARPSGAACDAGAYELTPPTVTTGAATSITSSGATLGATADPQGPPGTVSFQYGTSTAYGSQTTPQNLVSGFDTRTVTAAVTGLPAGAIVHYRPVVMTADGTTQGADATFTTSSSASGGSGGGTGGSGSGGSGGTGTTGGTGPGGSGADHTPPTLTHVSLSARRFHVASSPTALSAAQSRPHKVVRGTMIRLTLSEAASVTFTISRTTVVRRKHKRIVRHRTAGKLTRALGAGAQTVAFSGRIGSKALRVGNYQIVIVASDAAGNRSRASILTFTILRR